MVDTDCSSFYLMSLALFWDPWGSPRPFVCEFSGSWPVVSLTSPIWHEMTSSPFCFHSAMVPCMKGSPVIYISLIRLRLCVCRAHNNHMICVLVLSSIIRSRHLSASLITDLLSSQPILWCNLGGNYHK